MHVVDSYATFRLRLRDILFYHINYDLFCIIRASFNKIPHRVYEIQAFK